jgi:hypothetical protein
MLLIEIGQNKKYLSKVIGFLLLDPWPILQLKLWIKNGLQIKWSKINDLAKMIFVPPYFKRE